MKAIKTDKDILDKIENNEIVNVDSISSDDLFKTLIPQHYNLTLFISS